MDNIQFKPLKSKEVKDFLKILMTQFGIGIPVEDVGSKMDYYFFINNKDRIYLINREYNLIDTDPMRITHIGLYFCEYQANAIRLSIDGAQLFYSKFQKDITKNVIELTEPDIFAWIKGDDVDMSAYGNISDISSYAIVKHKEDVFGSGIVKDAKLLNFVPKARRLHEIFTQEIQ